MAAQIESCFNCDARIGRMEQAYIWQGNVVCKVCHQKLSKPTAPVPRPPAVPMQSAIIQNPPPPPTLNVNVKVKPHSSSLGIVSLILGILGLVICWMPCIGILGMPLSAVGLVLGIIGLIIALTRGGAGIGWPIGGIVVSGLALLIAGLITIALVGATTAVEERRAEERSKPKGTLEVERVWVENLGDTNYVYALVKYTNDTQERFTSAVTIQATAYDKKGEPINMNTRSFFVHEVGTIEPGFTSRIKIPVECYHHAVKNVQCVITKAR